MTTAEPAGVSYAVPDDHPAFAGHFPGRPILPGVVLLAEALAAIEAQVPGSTWAVDSVKFVNPVGPGTRLTISHQSQAAGRVRFEIRDAEGLVALGALSPRVP